MTLLNVPVGAVIDYAGNTIPSGYLECDGSAVSRATYASLFAAVGTAWGAGDGSTTFNLPDLRDRVTLGRSSTRALAATGGEEKHALTVAEMPSHAHDYVEGGYALGMETTRAETSSGFSGGGYWNGINKYRTKIASAGGQPHSLMQPYATVRKLIRC